MKQSALVLMVLFLLACGVLPGGGTPAITPPGQTAAPIATAAPTLTPTPAAPTLTRLTEPGCCAGAFWSADSRMVLFVDKPTDADPPGIYGVSVSGGPEQPVNPQPGVFSADGKFLAFVSADNQTVIRKLDGAVDAVIANQGQRPWISPGDTRIAWVIAKQVDVTIGTRVDIFTAAIDGSATQQLITVYNGGIAGWLDEDHLLVAGRKSAEVGNIILFSLDVTSGAQVDIASERRMRNISAAPGGKWVSYAVTFDRPEPDKNGIWVASADGLTKTKLPVAGAAQWRGDHRLLIVPLDVGAASHRLWQFDAATGQGGDLTDPSITPFRVAVGEWSVSPDGGMVVFLNQADHALWLMTLPE